jgi:FRG domain
MDDLESKPHTIEHRVGSWEEFQQYATTFEDPTRKPWDEVWFRGQSDAKWPLETTLERRFKKTWAVADYLNRIAEIQPAVETFTGAQFSLPNRSDLEQFCRQDKQFEFEQSLRGCATYLSHLRHGAFPSPLLDWTLSPYVAAYFAFHNATHDGDVAINAYREWAANIKIGEPDGPRIVSFGAIIKTHRRHFRQQSRYTTCVQFDGRKWVFTPHDAVFGQKDRLGRDLLWKVTIPATERLKVLRFCDKVNLNGYTVRQ